MHIDQSIAHPWVWMNGEVVRSSEAHVSVFDKSFQIGDGVFDTLRILDTCPLEWVAHWKRFNTTVKQFRFAPTISEDDCLDALHRLLKKNRVRDAIARITLSRGVGPRGYSPKMAGTPTLVLSLHRSPTIVAGEPSQWRLGIVPFPFPDAPLLTRHKTSSRIMHVLAKTIADEKQYDDALFLSTNGFVTEGISSNIFWIKNGGVRTPELGHGVVPGTTRDLILKLCKDHDIETNETQATIHDLEKADGVFLSVSTSGVIEVSEIGGKKLKRHALTKELHSWVEEHHRRSAKDFNSRNANELSI